MEISWIHGLIGGLMIGAAAAIYLLVNGRIMGASGIAGSLMDGTAGSAFWERAAFVGGVIGVPALASLFMDMPATNVTSNIPLLIVAGVLVGLGTRLGSGCTSGHGVCGMSRLSVRSIVATCIYIGAGVLVIIAARSMGVL
ncbi:YeeE/YedE family protein [Amylibacter sp. IMCC11727]|uniref:YeeE/YedE family protein n=1 Tax=Amylibacter sp. IMCC11727 TaxID=3039851 RepID=UPI00244DC62D|nr:YeeE/YedE family protein [Amylibacter sp. IMCC11727]WGI23160.1 YeeE/YedE family protein [Amylibacter sp. IMCC11727]